MQMINVGALSAVVLAGLAAAQQFTVNTPTGSLVQCTPYLISWTGGVGPFIPQITQPGGGGAVIEQFPSTTSNSYSWNVDQPVGQRVTIVIVDSTGANAASGISPAVAAGRDSSCLSSSASGSSSAAGSSSASSSAAASTSAAASSSRPASTSASASRSGSSSSSAPSSTGSSGSSTGGASTISGFSAVVAGAVGVVVAALF